MSTPVPPPAPPRPAPRSAKAAATRRRLLEAAAQLGSTDGPEFSMRDVAEVAGVVPATAYTYFASRDHLLAELYASWIEELTAIPAPHDPDPGVRLRHLLAAAADAVAAEPLLARAFTLAMASADPAAVSIEERVHAAFASWIGAAVSDLELVDQQAFVRVLENAVFGALFRFARARTEGPPLGELLDETVDLLVHGAIRPRETSS